MTIHEYIKERIETVLQWGLHDPEARMIQRSMLKTIATHERALLAEFADDYPTVFELDISSLDAILKEE